MRSFDFAPLYRSTVGFDRLFDMLDNGVRSDWPPYNIEKIGDNIQAKLGQAEILVEDDIVKEIRDAAQ